MENWNENNSQYEMQWEQEDKSRISEVIENDSEEDKIFKEKFKGFVILGVILIVI